MPISPIGYESGEATRDSWGWLTVQLLFPLQIVSDRQTGVEMVPYLKTFAGNEPYWSLQKITILGDKSK